MCRLCRQRLSCCSARSVTRLRNGKPRPVRDERSTPDRECASRDSDFPCRLRDAASRRQRVELPQQTAVAAAERTETLGQTFRANSNLYRSAVPPQSRLVCLTDSESLAAEKFRFLGVRLQHLRRDRPLKKVLITSTIPQEGKSMVSANLACTLAQRTQQRTLLLEGDLRRPSLSQMFGLGRIPGICECLQGERNLMTQYLPSRRSGPLDSASRQRSEESSGAPAIRKTVCTDGSVELLGLIGSSSIRLPCCLWLTRASGCGWRMESFWSRVKELQRSGNYREALEALEPKKLIGALLNGSKRPAR